MKGMASGQGAGQDSDELAGQDLSPVRSIVDPYPTFNGIAVDPENSKVMMSDTNRKSLLIYDRAAGGHSGGPAQPRRQILGPRTQIGFVAGVAGDPASREVYVVNNDIEDRLAVFSYDAEGNAKPLRVLAVPHRAWGVSLGRSRQEMALSVQTFGVVVYRREARGLEPPLRSIRGPHTDMADPRGIYLDDLHEEIVVANHGNWNGEIARAVAPGSGPASRGERPLGGRFLPPSIATYPRNGEGDIPPLRIIQGPRTQLNWPMGIDVDTVHDEIAVANNGDNSILFFRRTDSGDRAPVRAIRGGRTQLNRPMAVAMDPKNDELWAANFGEHSAVVFARGAEGNVAPKRIIRNAPAGTPTGGFGNPMAVAYDSRRQQILVPN